MRPAAHTLQACQCQKQRRRLLLLCLRSEARAPVRTLVQMAFPYRGFTGTCSSEIFWLDPAVERLVFLHCT